MKKTEAYWPLILFLCLVKFVLPLFLQAPIYELQRDEFLYYQQGQHLALGYLENPPLLSWMGWISSWFGGSEAWIKLWPSLFGVLTLIVTCLITAELGGDRFAQFLAGLGIICSAYLRVHFLFQPNILDIFFWTAAIYFLIRYVNTQRPIYIYAMGVALALGWWSKYSIIFMAAAIVLSILLTRHRKLVVNRHTWLAILLTLVLIAPNIWWQYSHNWPVIHHMEELQQTQLQYLDPGDFIKDQLLLLLPVFFVWICGLIWTLKHPAYRFIGYAYILVLILLIAGKGKSYYSLGAYPMLLAAGAVAIERWTVKYRWVRYVAGILPLVLFIPMIPLLLPVWEPGKLAHFYESKGIAGTGALKWEDQHDHPLPQDFADMLGWKELSEKTEKFYNSLPDSMKQKTIIYGRHYGHAGSLTYYAKDKSFRDKVITDNGSFLLWVDENLNFENLVFIGHSYPEPDDEVFQHFEQVTLVDTVANPYSRQNGDKIIFYRNIDEQGLQLARDGLLEIKGRFTRR